MPFLDAVHLFFEPSATIEDRASVFGKEWQIALEYVLHQSGLEAMYTSRLSEKHDLWAFIGASCASMRDIFVVANAQSVWATEDDRSHFYHQSTGFGTLSERMKKAPSVFFFGDDDYARLEETSKWAVHVLIEESQGGQARERLNEKQEKEFLEYPGKYQFATRQDSLETEMLYQGNDFDYALIGILDIGSDHLEPDLTAGLKLEASGLELRRHQSLLYPTPSPSNVDAPVDIADLTSKQLCKYGVIPHDHGEYKDPAYPMSLSFRPMSILQMANKFLPVRSRRNSVIRESGEQYTVCIVSVSMHRIIENEEAGSTFGDLRKQLRLLHGRDGLRELRVLRGIKPSADSHLVRFVSSK